MQGKQYLRYFSTGPKKNPFDSVLNSFKLNGEKLSYYSLPALGDDRVSTLPYSIRVLLECAVRNCDEYNVKSSDVETILDWKKKTDTGVPEIPFKPARVLLQDFTGVPAIVDLAAMRDSMVKLGGNPKKINPLCPVDLVIDHSVQADVTRVPGSLDQNEAIEFERNYERFEFLKWGSKAFNNVLIVPPGSGIVHQVNLEYLARVVFNSKGVMYPDSVVGTDSHTTMINGLGVVGWGVGGIEAEAVMLGECISMVLPEVVGFYLSGQLPQGATATDLVLCITQQLRRRGVVGKFVEFYGPGVQTLSLADRATIANMAPEYGATIGYFPVDDKTMIYLRQSGRSESHLELVEKYLKAQELFRTADSPDPIFSGHVLNLDLSSVVPCVAGPKRPMDRVELTRMKADFKDALTADYGFKGFAVNEQNRKDTSPFIYKGKEYKLHHGSVVLAAITSCTNTSNPNVMLAAGILAKNALAKGLSVAPYIKTVLAPGSGVVTEYLERAGVTKALEALNFYLSGYGCMSCIGNSGDLDPEVADAIIAQDIVAASVLSGNRNFEGRIHPLCKANYLASPPLVVAYAIAGKVDIDFATEPIGHDQSGTPVFLTDIWPTLDEVAEVSLKVITPDMFREVYNRISHGTPRWNALEVKEGVQYEWKESSTYIHEPSYFKGLTSTPKPIENIENAYCLLNVGDSVTTDHISPAGSIAKNSPAAKYLINRGVEPKDFNTYGARRGNDEIMARGTFANIRLFNKLVGEVGPYTIHVPSGEKKAVFDAAAEYMASGQQLIILAGKEYGTGSSRDWAAKGPYLQGVKLVIAESFERIHRSNLVGMGILPCEFLKNSNADSLGLTGKERFSIELNDGDLKVNQLLIVKTDTGKEFKVRCRLDTEPEVAYYRNGGILNYVLRKLSA